MSALDRDQIATQARTLLDSRVGAVTNLADAQQAVARAEHAHRLAWKGALKDGWSEGELRRLGLSKPVFPRAKRTRAADVAADDPSAK